MKTETEEAEETEMILPKITPLMSHLNTILKDKIELFVNSSMHQSETRQIKYLEQSPRTHALHLRSWNYSSVPQLCSEL